MQTSTAFPNYIQMKPVIPDKIWHFVRACSVAIALAVVVLLFVLPDAGLFIWWRVLVPLLPLVFFAAPGLWRNTCPLAASSQIPRLFKFTKGKALPAWLREYGYVIGMTLFFLAVPTRIVWFNDSGSATGLLILVSLVVPFVMGIFYKGKSGWCSNMCPLLPVQRLYGQTPFITIPNSHCRPCVGCTKNCYDFNPSVAYLADQYSDGKHYTAYRKFFAAAFPGLIIAYFHSAASAVGSPLDVYASFLVAMCVSVGSFYILDSFIKVSTPKITALYAAAAINLYYWYSFPIFFRSMGTMLDIDIPLAVGRVAEALLLCVTIWWYIRTLRKEKMFISQILSSTPTTIDVGAKEALKKVALREEKSNVTVVANGSSLSVVSGKTLLEVAEQHEIPIESGCRMGVCGADPVTIEEGMGNVSEAGEDELATLRRLGLSNRCRMACSARVTGPVTVAFKPEKPTSREAQAPGLSEMPLYDKQIRRVVIIGNGIAGVTAADYIRRNHPECDIQIVGRERHHLYNRMAITRLIYGRSAMNGLFLMPDSWYEENKVACLLNTIVTRIETEAKEVVLGTGETLPYDRLILAMGSSSHVPPIEGYGAEGTYVLREAEDAMRIREYAQKTRATTAVVAGGGLLGLEAAYALHKVGLQVVVLERSERVLKRQLDHKGSEYLLAYLKRMGVEVLARAEVERVQAVEGRTASIQLKDKRQLPCDILLVAAGIQPNIELARQAGILTKQGVVVDDHMRTNVADIYAAGDVAEHRGRVFGLWAASTEQAEAAALNALGGNKAYEGTIPITILKVVGIELVSMGRLEAAEGESYIVKEDPAGSRYAKLVVSEGILVGAILLGFNEYTQAVTSYMKKKQIITPLLERLKTGDWAELSH